MSYSVEKINGCTQKLAFNFESLNLTDEIGVAVKAKQKEANFKGFRKGKAPLDMVQKFYGPQIETDALNRFIQNKIFEAIKEEDIKVVGQPVFENMKYDEGKSISFDAVVETFPVVELKDFSAFSFTRDKVETSEEEVETNIKNQISHKAEMKEVEDKGRKLENGLSAVFNFEGVKEDGSRPAEMKADEFLLEIGSGQFIPGFEEGMIGLKVGDKKNIEVTFPEDYQAADLQKAKVTFEVEVLEVKEKIFPELTEELAKELQFESIEDLTSKTKERIESQAKRAADEKLHQEILDKLISENAFDVPNALVFQQKDHLKKDLVGNLKQQGMTDEMMEDYFSKWEDDLQTKAVFQVKSGLVLDTLSKRYNIETSESDFENKLEEISKTTGMELDQIKTYYSSGSQLKNNMMYAIREEKTFEKIKEEVKVS